MDIEAEIQRISAQIDARLDEIEQIIISIVEAKEKILRIELSMLQDRITHLEQNRDEINYMATGLFSS